VDDCASAKRDYRPNEKETECIHAVCAPLGLVVPWPRQARPRNQAENEDDSRGEKREPDVDRDAHVAPPRISGRRA
jgi:hypothetical protein